MTPTRTATPTLVVVDLPSAGAPVTLLTNDGTGAFTKTPLDSGCASGAISAVIGQFVGDPRADVAVLCQTAQLRFLAPNTAGVFVPSGTQPTCGGVNGGDLDVGDFDEDGHDDLVAVCSQSRFSVHLAADSFVSRTGPTGDAWFNLNRGGSGIPLRVVATDLNGDGHIDVVTNSYTAAEPAPAWPPATAPAVSTRARDDVGTRVRSRPAMTWLGDVDDDGRPDLIAAAGAVGVAHNTTPTPAVSTGEAQPGAYGATVGAAVNPNGTATTYAIEYGASARYGRSTPSLPTGATLTGTANQHVSAALAGLAPLTTYHYRVVATNARGTTYGRDRTLRTTVVAPRSPAARESRARRGPGAPWPALRARGPAPRASRSRGCATGRRSPPAAATRPSAPTPATRSSAASPRATPAARPPRPAPRSS